MSGYPVGMRAMLIEAYLDFLNNYLTVAKYAEHHGLTTREGEAFINLAKAVASHPHPES